MVSSWIVLFLFLSNWFYPQRAEIACRSVEMHATGLAARGRGVNVAITSIDAFGNKTYRQVRASQLTCEDTFGEGWTEHDDQQSGDAH